MGPIKGDRAIDKAIDKAEVETIARRKKDPNFTGTIEPDFNKIIKLAGQGLIVTAPGLHHDFVSRYFCPKYGINEDPVTGSAHTTLTPYWSDKLSTKKLLAKQVSKRGGELFCENKDERVLIGGNAVLYMKGSINIS